MLTCLNQRTDGLTDHNYRMNNYKCYILQVWINFGRIHNRKCIDFFRYFFLQLIPTTKLIRKKSRNLSVIFSCRGRGGNTYRIDDLFICPQISFQNYLSCWLYRISEFFVILSCESSLSEIVLGKLDTIQISIQCKLFSKAKNCPYLAASKTATAKLFISRVHFL